MSGSFLLISKFCISLNPKELIIAEFYY